MFTDTSVLRASISCLTVRYHNQNTSFRLYKQVCNLNLSVATLVSRQWYQMNHYINRDILQESSLDIHGITGVTTTYYNGKSYLEIFRKSWWIYLELAYPSQNPPLTNLFYFAFNSFVCDNPSCDSESILSV